jgi:3-hydroxyisobutyrate dehydrogenase-like beta-hydroxyacid dehydrogenase
MDREIAFIGFGEAAQAFAGATPARAYDIKTDVSTTRDAKLADYAGSGVQGCDTAAAALAGARVVLSLVTADQALPAARLYANALAPGALWFDMNSAAPDTKREAAVAIEAAGGRYVDVAVMAPVHPQRLALPLLVSGPHAKAGAEALAAIGFTDVRVVAGAVGAASAIKMIRSVMIKGLEALTTECLLAAEAVGVRDDVFASLDANWPGVGWAAKASYNLERMMVHGTRRAAEMEEAVKALDSIGTGSAMTRATAKRQRAMGSLGLVPAPTLDARLDQLLLRSREQAA